MSRVSTLGFPATFMQDQALQTAQAISDSTITSGRLMKNVALQAGTNIVAHGLGRRVNGFIACGQSVAQSIKKNATTADESSRIISIDVAAPMILDLWVF